jgi:hypothetical protein
MLRRTPPPPALMVALAAVAVAPFAAGSLAHGAVESAQRHARAVLQSLACGQLPFWDPWVCGGAAVWQNPMVSVIAPAYPLSIFMPLEVAATMSVALHFCAAAAGLYVLLRRVARVESPWGSAAVATALVLAGALALRANASRDESLAVMVLPWLFYFLLRPTGGQVRNAVLGAVVIAAMVLDGGTAVLPIAALLVALVGSAVRLARGTWTPLVTSCLSLVVGVGLAAPRLVPAARFVNSDSIADVRSGDSRQEEAAAAGCGGRFSLKPTAQADRPALYGEGPLRIFDGTISPNRIAARVAVIGPERASLVLNQNFSAGWSSDAGQVIDEPGTGNPAIVLPRDFAGRATFTFVPSGMRPGGALFLAAAVVCFVAWRRPAATAQAMSRVGVMTGRPRAWVAAHALDLAVVMAAAAGFLWIYWRYPYHPTLPNNGWWNFFDQSQYLRSARALARGDWSAAEHTYPIGYPGLAVPFVNLSARDPFLPVNLTLFVGFAWCCYRLFRPALGGLMAAAVFFAALALPTEIVTPQHIGYPIWSQFAVPWTTTGVAPLYVGALLAIRFNWERHRAGVDLLIGAIVGAVVCVRPADALPLAAIVAVYGIHVLLATRRPVPVLRMAAGAVAGAAPFLLFMSNVYSGGVSPYMRNWRTVGFTFSNLNERAYQMLLRSEDTYGELHSALFQLQPWLYLAVPLAIVWACAEPVIGAFAVVLALSSWALYLGYNDFTPFNTLRFFLVHYFVWALPVLAAGGLAGGLHIVKRRRWLAAAAVVVAAVVLSSLRFIPAPVSVSDAKREPSPCCGVRYTLSFPSVQDIDAVDVVTPVPPQENIFTLSQKDIELVVDETRFDPLWGYQVLRRADGIRIMFKGNVSASRLAFTLDERFAPLSDPTQSVRPIRFRASLRSPDRAD